MSRIYSISDPVECRKIWEEFIPVENITDLWEFRECFHKHFQRPLYFVIFEEEGKVRGLLPLSWIEEKERYGYFPGETWEGKTWLEQNKIYAETPEIMKEMLEYMEKRGEKYHLRYLMDQETLGEVDEIGYLFLPSKFDFDMNNYLNTFSGKMRKNLRKEREILVSSGEEFRYDLLEDFDMMVNWNIERYGESSYFSNLLFRKSFFEVVNFLKEKNLLRITTIILGGEPAAVDIGCVYKNKYTLLAGGTNPKFRGVAKLINLHHMSRACEEKIDQVDFLCGDFSWKTLFHLTSRPLHLFSNLDSSGII